MSITVQGGTAVTDTAILSGANASTATGTVTYDAYSDSACTVTVSNGTAQAITTPGILPALSPVTLSTPGTYYWQASYSGDTDNGPSTSTCGTAGEVETVASCDDPVGNSSHPDYCIPADWNAHTLTNIPVQVQGMEPLNVIISANSTVPLATILGSLNPTWEQVSIGTKPPGCISGETADVTGGGQVLQAQSRA